MEHTGKLPTTKSFWEATALVEDRVSARNELKHGIVSKIAPRLIPPSMKAKRGKSVSPVFARYFQGASAEFWLITAQTSPEPSFWQSAWLPRNNSWRLLRKLVSHSKTTTSPSAPPCVNSATI